MLRVDTQPYGKIESTKGLFIPGRTSSLSPTSTNNSFCDMLPGMASNRGSRGRRDRDERGCQNNSIQVFDNPISLNKKPLPSVVTASHVAEPRISRIPNRVNSISDFNQLTREQAIAKKEELWVNGTEKDYPRLSPYWISIINFNPNESSNSIAAAPIEENAAETLEEPSSPRVKKYDEFIKKLDFISDSELKFNGRVIDLNKKSDVKYLKEQFFEDCESAVSYRNSFEKALKNEIQKGNLKQSRLVQLLEILQDDPRKDPDGNNNIPIQKENSFESDGYLGKLKKIFSKIEKTIKTVDFYFYSKKLDFHRDINNKKNPFFSSLFK